MFNSSVGGRIFSLFKEKKNLKNSKIQKNNLLVFVFYGTIYRLYHTHSLGSVEPTIALSESLWSRIVTKIKKKSKKKKNQKIKKIYKNIYFCFFCACVYIYVCSVFILSNSDDDLSLSCCD